MRYQITHQIRYKYERAVVLAPHFLRLRPRCDITQKLHRFSLEVEPAPEQVSELVDLDGNATLKAWFAEEGAQELVIQAVSEVETFRTNPFTYLLEPWAVTLPINYPVALWHQLQPYLSGQFAGGVTPAPDPTAAQLAQEIWLETNGNSVAFLSELNQRIYQTCGYTLRETGSPYPPSITWSRKSGSCRDYAVLFMEVCRAAGLATRFVSGYQEGDLDRDDRHLHAWAEVYLPGAGWRGYDPTHGLAVADRHIALVATPTSRDSAPVSGSLKTTGVPAEMEYWLKIEILA
ncbi:MAG: transglutaminase family protein [Leptolyngbya sp. IPPAS B-1204]|uniref:Transglutaminase family protein n=1 Tax=Leptolyngbya sp. NK1-12 TaxID=2547451 RepID=A0AA97AJ43_9CYAN|nr:transglutaminase family protein [Leptolyngbya sp. NK1-12]MBF2050666.1 transglutaminase family protein [Elainella sp. C42_A2020_010]RNJ70513.1 MAG: transglutaminase family protein [Leptolyngbya sp. IPPAS B-1204]WNZ22427.1 transglutaminase family protein [Leptolyngbya sp. NK1-12]